MRQPVPASTEASSFKMSKRITVNLITSGGSLVRSITGKGRSWADQQLNINARFLNNPVNFSDEINSRGVERL